MTSLSSVSCIAPPLAPYVLGEVIGVSVTKVLDTIKGGLHFVSSGELSPAIASGEWISCVLASVKESSRALQMADLCNALFIEDASDDALRGYFTDCPLKEQLSALVCKKDGVNLEDLKYGEDKILLKPRELKHLFLSLTAEDGEIYVAFKLWESQALHCVKNSLQTDILGGSVVSLAFEGDADILRFLLSQDIQIKKNHLVSAVRSAARRGNLEFIQVLLGGERVRSLDARDFHDAVLFAAGSGRFQVIEFLLSMRPIYQGVLAEAVEKAASTGHIETLRVLLSDGRTLVGGALSEAVLKAAEKGHIEAVQFLLSDGRELNEHRLGKIVREVLEKGDLNAIPALLSDGRTIHRVILEYAVNEAALRGRLDIVQSLLKGRRISQNELLSAVLKALEKGFIDVVQYLLSGERRIADLEKRGRLVMLLCSCARTEKGYADVIEHLLQSGPILRSQQQSAITLASGPRSEQIREILSHAVIVDDPINAGGYIEPNRLIITSLSDVEEDPFSYFQIIMGNGYLPSRIYVAGSPVVDNGGITKEFVTRLFNGLVKKEIIPLYGELKVLCPSEYKGHTQEAMQNLGALYSLLYARNETRTDKALTGSVFDPLFFELLRMASIGASEEARLHFLAERIQGSSDYARLVLDPDNEVLKQAVAQLFLGEKEEALDVAREELLKLVRASEDFYKGTSGSFKEAIASMEPSVLCTQVQGEEITAQKIVDAIRVQNPSEALGIKLDWLLEKIHTSDDAFRKAFLYMVTGQVSIRPGVEIFVTLRTGRDEFIFAAHTCTNSVELPSLEVDKETFLAALESVVYRSDFNIA